MNSAKATEVHIANVSIPLQRRDSDAHGEFHAELWCEFDCIAYVFTGDDCEEISARLQAARGGEHTWDYVRPLSKDELYAGLV